MAAGSPKENVGISMMEPSMTRPCQVNGVRPVCTGAAGGGAAAGAVAAGAAVVGAALVLAVGAAVLICSYCATRSEMSSSALEPKIAMG